jgi:hydrogenase-4 component B
MLVLLLLLLASYAVGIALGISGLVASEPLTALVGTDIPFLTFAVRLDPLAAFFVLTISFAAFCRERSHASHYSP